MSQIEFAVAWGLVLAWFVAGAIPTLWFVGKSLSRQSDRVADPREWPFVSIVVPARDEGAKVEAGLRSLLQSDYPHFEVIALDDRSRDDTGAIMDRIAAESEESQGEQSDRNGLLKVFHIKDLPAGWLGKNHALQVGSQQSRGDWLLFTDGDVIHKPDTLRRSMKYVLAREIDHLPLYPSIDAHGVFEAAFVACFGLIFTAGTQPGLVPTACPWFYSGVGAFNLVRRKAFDRAGTFEPIRLDILDDVKLGKLLKRTGSRSEVLRSGDRLNIRWQQSAWTCVTGLEKNAFAAAEFSLIKLFWIVGVTLLIFMGPLIGMLVSHEARPIFAVAFVLSHGVYAMNSVVFGQTVWITPLMIPSALAFVFAFLRSAWITLRQRGVRWRDTFYPLGVLRQNVYR